MVVVISVVLLSIRLVAVLLRGEEFVELLRHDFLLFVFNHCIDGRLKGQAFDNLTHGYG